MTRARPKPEHPLPLTLPPATADLLALWPDERPVEVIRRALLLRGIADGRLDAAGRPKRPGPKRVRR